MTRRLVSALIAVLGLVAIALAVCSATVWRPSATAVATMSARPGQNYVLVEPGVLGLVDADVTVQAQASSKPVFLAVAYADDARSWLAQDPYTSVTGLTSWTQLATRSVTEQCPTRQTASTASPSAEASAQATQAASAQPTADSRGCVRLTTTGANPAGADVWLLTSTGKGTATLKVDASDPDLVLIAATDGRSPAPTLTLSWPRTVSTPWLIPGLVVGGLLLLAGVFGLLIDVQMRRAAAERRERAAQRAARLASADSTMTLGIPAVTDPNRPLTRRERREKERAEAAGEEWIDPRTGPVALAAAQAAARAGVEDSESPDAVELGAGDADQAEVEVADAEEADAEGLPEDGVLTDAAELDEAGEPDEADADQAEEPGAPDAVEPEAGPAEADGFADAAELGEAGEPDEADADQAEEPGEPDPHDVASPQDAVAPQAGTESEAGADQDEHVTDSQGEENK